LKMWEISNILCYYVVTEFPLAAWFVDLMSAWRKHGSGKIAAFETHSSIVFLFVEWIGTSIFANESDRQLNHSFAEDEKCFSTLFIEIPRPSLASTLQNTRFHWYPENFIHQEIHTSGHTSNENFVKIQNFL
jgi:hypothetical protein